MKLKLKIQFRYVLVETSCLNILYQKSISDEDISFHRDEMRQLIRDLLERIGRNCSTPTLQYSICLSEAEGKLANFLEKN